VITRLKRASAKRLSLQETAPATTGSWCTECQSPQLPAYKDADVQPIPQAGKGDAAALVNPVPVLDPGSSAEIPAEHQASEAIRPPRQVWGKTGGSAPEYARPPARILLPVPRGHPAPHGYNTVRATKPPLNGARLPESDAAAVAGALSVEPDRAA
jgi:hypothetical protein